VNVGIQDCALKSLVYANMRFRSHVHNVGTFASKSRWVGWWNHSVTGLAEFCASLSSLGPIAWCRLTDDDIRFTVLPEKGSQVWSVLKIETVFDTYSLQSAAPNNTINLEVPIQALQRALKSAQGATSTSIRLTKKNNVPMLSLTILTTTFSSGHSVVGTAITGTDDEFGDFDFHEDSVEAAGPPRERETVITQDVPVKVLAMQTVEGLHEPSTPESDVHIFLPALAQVKSISERFTKLATATKAGSTTGAGPRLELSANMHGSFKIALQTDALSISSVWTGLVNPELEPKNYPGGSQEIRDHPSTRMRQLGGHHGENEAGWARVRIDAKDWNRVLSVGRLGVRVIACEQFLSVPDYARLTFIRLHERDGPCLVRLSSE
jgi:HUS1 checkpoint protein